MKIVSACCGKHMRWVKRLPATYIGTGEYFRGAELLKETLGGLIRAYVCDGCGKADR